MTPILADAAIRSGILVLIGLGLVALLRQHSAALRHAVLAASLCAAAVVLPLTRALPSWTPPLLAAVTRSEEPSVHVQTRAITIADRDATSGSQRSGLSLIAIAWMAGLIGCGTMLVAGLVRLLWITRRAVPVTGDRWMRAAWEVAAAYGLKRPPRLLQTADPGMLATWGFLRPCVLLPSGADAWADERVHVVLCHELAHVRRRDWIVQIAADVLRVFYWFNPLLWLACSRLRRESEQACDDIVLGAGIQGRTYAGHLLAIARTARRTGPMWSPATPMSRPSTLERRIAAMLNDDVRRTAPSLQALAWTALALSLITIPIAAVGAPQNGPMPLAGSVYDPTGAVLPEVVLTLEDAQHVTSRATTDSAGHFEFPTVEPGRYVLQATLPGFRPLRQEIDLRTAADWDRAITLQVSAVRETIVVRERRVSAPPSPAAGPVRIKVGGNIRPPMKLRDVKPVYPATMRDEGREGVVPIEAIIGRDGTVHSVRVLTAQIHPDFALAAADAVRQWRFAPTLLNGAPVEVVMTVSVEFSLSE